jgi:rhodanese-related sulfurtransferase
MKNITTEELAAKKDRGEQFTFVNTLDAKDFAKSHIPDSINVPQSAPDFAQRVEQAAGGKDQPVVVYCASSQCDSSAKAAEKLEAAGFTNVTKYEEGAEGWHDAGKELAEV